MQFTIRNWAIKKARILRDARTVILLYKIKPSEYKLNKYLIEKYNMNLIGVSLYLLQHCKAYKGMDYSTVILFPNKEDDKLASFITYGNITIPGSTILKEAFFRKD